MPSMLSTVSSILCRRSKTSFSLVPFFMPDRSEKAGRRRGFKTVLPRVVRENPSSFERLCSGETARAAAAERAGGAR